MRTSWLVLSTLLAACSSGKQASPPHQARYKLEALPYLAFTMGLPISGQTSVKVDSTLLGVTDWTTAHGVASIRCDGCRVGNDVARLQVTKPATTSEGLPFGHLELGQGSLSVGFAGGALLFEGELQSPELELHATVTGTAAKVLGDTRITGCVQFRATEALRQRDPETYAVVLATGAVTDAEGWSTITIEGTIDHPRRLGKTCAMPRVARST